MKDITGQDIKVGSKVAYAFKKGNRVALHTGTVKEVDIAIYPGQPERVSAAVESRGQKQSLKEGKELVVYG